MAKIKVLTHEGAAKLVGIIKTRIEKESYIAAGKSLNKLLSTEVYTEPGVGESAKVKFDSAVSLVDTKLKSLCSKLSINENSGIIDIFEALLSKVNGINVPSFSAVITFNFDKDTHTSLTISQVFGSSISDSDAHKDDAISSLPSESGKYTFYLIKNIDGTYQTFFSKLPEGDSVESITTSEVEDLVNNAFNS